MPKKSQEENSASQSGPNAIITLKNEIQRHIRFTMGRDPEKPNRHACFMGLAYTIRDRLIDRWIRTQRSQYDTLAKRVYFLSLEFLPGRFLMNYLISLKLVDEVRQAVAEMGFDLDELEEEEWDAGLGNGGLGRLASCYMDSLACLRPSRLRLRHPLRLRHFPSDDRKRLAAGAVRQLVTVWDAPGKSAGENL